ncbi:MAG TPA: glycosyltransferase family A protein [Hanamia sp.]|nr:glycosyltransferase family A protein [Hanamia sp.]
MDPIDSPIVSVIVPCYNYAHFLPEALDSVLAQTYPHWECIIINDGSPDNTEEVAMKYCKKDSRIKYFYKENGGHSSARNFGIRMSVGKYILPLDADDRISNIYLEKAVAILETETDVKSVTGEVQLFGNADSRLKMPGYDLRSFLIVNYITISSLFRRSDYDSTKGFDETMLVFEDWDLFISLLANGGTVKELPFTCLFYRKKEVSMFHSGLTDKKRVYKDLLKLYNNHSDTYQEYFDSPIELIQENEKMKRVINNYQQTNTYRMGLLFNKIKKRFLRKTITNSF